MRYAFSVLVLAACGSDVSYYGVSGHSGGRWDADGDGLYERTLTCEQIGEGTDIEVGEGAIVQIDDCTSLACSTIDAMPDDEGRVDVGSCGQASVYQVVRWWFPTA